MGRKMKDIAGIRETSRIPANLPSRRRRARGGLAPAAWGLDALPYAFSALLRMLQRSPEGEAGVRYIFPC